MEVEVEAKGGGERVGVVGKVMLEDVIRVAGV